MVWIKSKKLTIIWNWLFRTISKTYYQKFGLKLKWMTCYYLWRVSPLSSQAPVAQKNADEVVFWHFQGEGVEFWKIGPHWPPSDFGCAFFGKYQFKPFQISFFSGFYVKILFWVRWFYSLLERKRLKRKKRCLFTLTKLQSHHFI